MISNNILYKYALQACCLYCILVWEILQRVELLLGHTILEIAAIFCLCIFTFNIYISVLTRPGYSISLYCLLDVLTALSLLFSNSLLCGDLLDSWQDSEVWFRVGLGIHSFQIFRFSSLFVITLSLSDKLFECGMFFVLCVFWVIPILGKDAYFWEWWSIVRYACVFVILLISRKWIFCDSGFRVLTDPVDSMVKKINFIRKDPMAYTHWDKDKERRLYEMEQIVLLAKLNTAQTFFSKWRAKRELLLLPPPPSDVLDATISRIGSLLAVGFGAAGGRIVAANMADLESMEIHAKVPGRRIEAIFGNFKIVNFSLLTSVLKNQVMKFVNQVCEIIHGIVDEFHGVPYRCVGETFLVVWPPDNYDLAVAACVKIQIAINRSLELHEYRLHPNLTKFRVRLHMGLHRGWAIEGAIGSNLKIDPSYLSPDVNQAETLQNLCATYNTVVFLASKTFVKSCTKETQRFFRQIDLEIYSLDLDVDRDDFLSSYEIKNSQITGPRTVSMRADETPNLGPFRVRQDRERRKADKKSSPLAAHTTIIKDKYFKKLREPFNAFFLERFRNGFLNFACGEWEIARSALKDLYLTRECVLWEKNQQKTTHVKFTDGPSMYLLAQASAHIP